MKKKLYPNKQWSGITLHLQASSLPSHSEILRDAEEKRAYSPAV